MSEHAHSPGLWPIPGDGVLARQGDLVLLIHPAGGTFTDRLLDLLTDSTRTGGDGRRFADLAAAAFDSDAAAAAGSMAGNEQAPAAVAFGPDGGGTAMAVYGTAWAEVAHADGVQLLTAGQPYGRLRCVLPARAITVRAGVRARDSDESTDPYLRLAGGIVRAVGLLYIPEAGIPEAGIPEAGIPEVGGAEAAAGVGAAAVEAGGGEAAAGVGAAAVEAGGGEAAAGDVAPAVEVDGREAHFVKQDFVSVQLSGDKAADHMPPRKPLPLGAEPPDPEDGGIAERPPPLVIGVYCKNGHFDDPEARYCAVCGIGMAQLTKVPRSGARPPLGVLVLDDGSVFRLDADYVLGREPSLDTSVAEGRARPLRLADASGLVSRIHARLELDGWQVFISDLNSANGTYISPPGEQNSQRLAPGVRTPLGIGAHVRLGRDCGFRYDSHRRR